MSPEEEEQKTEQVVDQEDDFEFGNPASVQGVQAAQSGEGNGDGKEGDGEEGDGGIQGAQGIQPAQSAEDVAAQGVQEIQSVEGIQAAQEAQDAGISDAQGVQGVQGVQSVVEKEADFFEGIEQAAESGEIKTDKFSYKSFAKENFEIDLEVDDEKSFRTAINNKINEARQEFKMDGITPEAQKLFKHLNESGGSVLDFIKNENIINYQSFLSMDAEDQYRSVREAELEGSVSSDEIDAKIDQELESMSAGDLKKISDGYEANVTKMMNTEVNKIIEDRQKLIDQQTQRDQQLAAEERQEMIRMVNKTDEIMGIKLSEKGKKIIVAEIENGTFDRIVDKNQAQSKIFAYFLSKFGGKIKDFYTKSAILASRQGYNEAAAKSQSELHNTAGKVVAGASGRERDGGVKKTGFDAWSDQSLFEENQSE